MDRSVHSHWIADLIPKQKFLVLILEDTLFWHHKIKNSSILVLCKAPNGYEIADSLPCCMAAASHWTSEVSVPAIGRTDLVLRCKPLLVVFPILTSGCWDDIKPPVSVRVAALSFLLLCVFKGRERWLVVCDKLGWCCSVRAAPVWLQHTCLPCMKAQLCVREFQQKNNYVMVLVLHDFWARPNLWSHRSFEEEVTEK